jgi:hypothetical protein
MRWLAWRKAEIVTAVSGGLLSLEEACTRYRLTLDELASWSTAYTRHGVNGLMVRRLRNRN